jgi:hypothetical protein
MPPTPTQQPASNKPKRSRWFKGCLIALVVPSLILGLFSAWLLTGPTGYDEVAKTSRDVQERIRTPRLKPRSPKNSPRAPIVNPSARPAPASPVSQEPAASLSPEDTRFWGDARARLEWWTEAFPDYLLAFHPTTLPPEVLTSISLTLTPQGGTTNTEALKTFWKQSERDRIRQDLPERNRERPLSTEDYEVVRMNETRLIQIGNWVTSEMNRVDTFISDGRLGKTELDKIFPYSEWGFNSPVFETVYLTLRRAIRRGETEKASQLVEQAVLLSGEFLFDTQSSRELSDWEHTSLKQFLVCIAAEPGIPEDVLDWTATTLASWKLTPQEYADLCVANLNRSRDALMAALQEPVAPDEAVFGSRRVDYWNLCLSGVPGRMVSNVMKPILFQAIDRKVVALTHRDAVEYEKAQWAQTLACLTMKHLEERIVHSPVFPADRNYQLLTRRKDAHSFTELFIRQDKETEKTFSSIADFSPELLTQHFNDQIETTRLVFAAARYRREYGQYPDSVEAMIPRYLDESFAPTPEQFWLTIPMKPDTVVVMKTPYDDVSTPAGPPGTKNVRYYSRFGNNISTTFTLVLRDYCADPRNADKLPSGPEDLKPYTPTGTDPASFGEHFVKIGNAPIFCRVSVMKPSPAPEQERQRESGDASRPDSPVYLLCSQIPPWELKDTGTHSPPPPFSAPPEKRE